MKQILNIILIIIGSISLVMGIIGIALPVLPTTPFILLSAACYLRSSKHLYTKLINSKRLGPYLKNYLEGRGLPLRVKHVSICSLWSGIGASIIFAVDLLYIRILLLVIAIGVTWHISSLKTIEKGKEHNENKK